MDVKISKSNKTALVFGIDRPVGREVLEQLLFHSAYEKVVVFSEEIIQNNSPKLIQQKIDFEKIEEIQSQIVGDDIFLCLTGSFAESAGSKKFFFKKNHTLVFQVAKMAAMNRVSQLLLLSSAGANPRSIFYHLKVRGEMEAAIRKLPFWSIHVFRPSIILEERNENRFGESVAEKIGNAFNAFSGNFLSKIKPVEADIVAKVMISEAQRVLEGIHFHNNEKMQKIADRVDKFLQ